MASRLVRVAFRYALEANSLLSWLLEVRSEFRWRRAMREAGHFRKVPLTQRELYLHRVLGVHIYIEACGTYPALDGGFTCDDCDIACWCKLCYDLYNTNGDCLLSK